MQGLNIKPKKIIKDLTAFICKTISNKGFDKVILGLSGGLDSTIVAFLAAKALGRDNVMGVIMPYGKLSKESTKDAKRVVDILNIRAEYIDIAPMVDAYFKKAGNSSMLRRGNKMARERMSILYDLSKKYNSIVIGTSNKTETLLGYGTIHGDCAWAMNPIGNLYKSQLRILARDLGVPRLIIDKPPTAGLWDGQTDEEELGYSYADIDNLLFHMLDKKLSSKELLKKGFDKEFISDIRKKIKNNRFKSQPPIIAKI